MVCNVFHLTLSFVRRRGFWSRRSAGRHELPRATARGSHRGGEKASWGHQGSWDFAITMHRVVGGSSIHVETMSRDQTIYSVRWCCLFCCFTLNLTPCIVVKTVLWVRQKGYDELQAIVPKCQQTDALGSTKVSKATVLQRCKRAHRQISYIRFTSFHFIV